MLQCLTSYQDVVVLPYMAETERKKRRVLIDLPNNEQGRTLWKLVKIAAANKEITMSEWIIDAIREKLAKEKK